MWYIDPIKAQHSSRADSNGLPPGRQIAKSRLVAAEGAGETIIMLM